MYVQVLWCGRVLRAPDVWGTDILLQNESLQLTVSAWAVAYLCLYVLDAATLSAAFDDMPQLTAALEATRRKWACRRMLVRLAEQTCRKEGKLFLGRSFPLYGAGLVADEAEGRPRLSLDRTFVTRRDSLDAYRGAEAISISAHSRKAQEEAIQQAANVFGHQAMRRAQFDAVQSAKEEHAKLAKLQSDVQAIADAQRQLAQVVTSAMSHLASKQTLATGVPAGGVFPWLAERIPAKNSNESPGTPLSA